MGCRFPWPAAAAFPDLTNLIERYLANDVTTFLDAHRLTKDDIGAWVSHPGGPKVIDAVATSLALPPEALELTWRSLGEIGNLRRPRYCIFCATPSKSGHPAEAPG